MRKKLLAVCLAVFLLSGLMVSCQRGDAAGRQVINVWSFTDELYRMISRFMELNPDIAQRYVVNFVEISTTDGAYQPALDMALMGGGASAPDIFAAESAFVLRYTQGEASHFAAPFASLGINVEAAVLAAQIAPYTVEVGRNRNGEIVALGFQATGGAFIYRRSIARQVFGTDDPAVIAREIGPGWPRFWEAAARLRAHGVAIVSGDGDLWHPVRGASPQGWMDADGFLVICPSREAFLDMSMTLMRNDWHNDTEDWSDSWFADFRGEGAKPVFGFFGPAWLVNYVLAPNAGPTYGDWAVTIPPEGFFWGGTWVMANRNTRHANVVARIIEWITLDTSTTGLQYMWANGTLFGPGGTKDVVASGVVMAIADGTVGILGGQDMFEVFIPANAYARADNMTEFDEHINIIWRDQVRQFTGGHKTRAQALADFRQLVNDTLFIPSR